MRMKCKHCAQEHDALEMLACFESQVKCWREERDRTKAWGEGLEKELKAASLQNDEYRKALEEIRRDAEKHSGWWARRTADLVLERFAKKPLREDLRSGYCREGEHKDCPVECKNGPCECSCHVALKRIDERRHVAFGNCSLDYCPMCKDAAEHGVTGQ